MIITFCGHADFVSTKEYERLFLAALKDKIKDSTAELYLGGYGAFDRFAYTCCKKYQKENPTVSLVFVTPYRSISYQKMRLEASEAQYDAILYPPIEDKPPKFALVYRNRYMAEKADLLIAYVNRSWGGAYQMYQYAKQKGKRVLNLATFSSGSSKSEQDP